MKKLRHPRFLIPSWVLVSHSCGYLTFSAAANLIHSWAIDCFFMYKLYFIFFMFPNSFRVSESLLLQFVGRLVFHTVFPLELVNYSCTFSQSMRKSGWYPIAKGRLTQSWEHLDINRTSKHLVSGELSKTEGLNYTFCVIKRISGGACVLSLLVFPAFLLPFFLSFPLSLSFWIMNSNIIFI